MNWWERFFDEDYAARFMPQEVDIEAGQLRNLLQLQAGARVFDQCCGQGRFSRALADLGLVPVGVDANAEYVERARKSCTAGRFFCQDARDFRAKPVCQGAFNVYSSFGYVPDHASSVRMLSSALHSLRPGSRMVLDTINFGRVVSEFQPLIVQSFEDGVRVERHSRLNWEEGLLEQHWIFERPGQERRTQATATRMFWPRDLADLLRTAGFEPVELYGDLSGSPFETSSRRLVWVARRP